LRRSIWRQRRGSTASYSEWQLDGKALGGMADIRGRVPDEVPAHWGADFAVMRPSEETIARAREQGKV
jgi:hypothetical protein